MSEQENQEGMTEPRRLADVPHYSVPKVRQTGAYGHVDKPFAPHTETVLLEADIRPLVARLETEVAELLETRNIGEINLALLFQTTTERDNAEARALKAEAEVAALRAQLEQEIEQWLARLKAESYGVDVREKSNSVTHVIATVVDHSTAMHALLYVRQVVRKGAVVRSPVPPGEETQR